MFAYHVFPQEQTSTAGGAIAPTAALENALNATFDTTQVATGPMVTLRIDPTSPTRAHAIRDVALTIAFAVDPQKASVVSSAAKLAARLCEIMDHRSSPALLLLSAHEGTTRGDRRFIIWTFPQQEVFSFSMRGSTTRLEVANAFARESNLRKVAFLEGKNVPAGMLKARVRDFQTSATERAAADFWIEKFLHARLQMDSTEGTRLLAQALRSVYNAAAGDEQRQEELNAVIAAVRVGRQRRLSINEVARRLSPLSGSALTTGISDEESAALFQLDAQAFDSLIQYRRFMLEGGAIVSAPFFEMNRAGIEITELNGRRGLRLEGFIMQERVTTRG
ncbi:hypothetical protein A5625_14595 [Mycobacterium sp. 1465703.0]|nr:hypothetical protein A5625_14595 [Mycobacterium sp. 1465703.0]